VKLASLNFSIMRAVCIISEFHCHAQVPTSGRHLIASFSGGILMMVNIQYVYMRLNKGL